ncbi:hypothetical protein C9374_007369 [Naegleria lovaniensis]|uniref:S1 motif domain-containing protein n=1 Tax=Naegleria lovaniensis TaxID=51637 RepID=A0AA88GLT6_NAELO|nr:uncharacterized protein C9374_007369 [Naegleria lovaniensis]KAG2379230.1 hypothetical protein C9374_007369 [Naegleria lovaniensis]
MSSNFIEEEAELDEEELQEKQLRHDDDEDSEEENETGEDLDAYEKDDFIVDDDEIDEGEQVPPPIDQESNLHKRKTHPSKKKRKFKRLKKGEENLLSKEVSDLVQQQQQENEPEAGDMEDDYGEDEDEDDRFIDGDDQEDDIFGTDEEEEDYLPVEEEEERKYTLKDIFGADLLKEKFLTEEDEVIRNEDVPERISLRQGIRLLDPDELYNEACWIYSKVFQSHAELHMERYRKYIEYDSNRFDSLKNLFVETIVKVLKFILQMRYDIPYISQYKKEEFEHVLQVEGKFNDKDLWKILEWDEKWCVLQSKKKKLKSLYDSAKTLIDPYYLSQLDYCDSIDYINDLQLHFTSILSEDSEVQIGEYKRPKKKDTYSLAKREGLAPLANRMALSSQQYAENLSNEVAVHEPEDYQQDPIKAAEEFKTAIFDSEESVLSATRHYCAYQIAHEPRIRDIVRSKFENHATIKIKLTKRGKALKSVEDTEDVESSFLSLFRARDRHRENIFTQQDDEYTTHIHYLNEDPEIYLRIVKYETLGFLKMSLYLEDRYFDDLFKASDLYLSQKHSQLATSWNDHRLKIIEEAKGILNRSINSTVKNNLKEKACEKICELCEDKLTQMLMEGPYDLKSDSPFNYKDFVEDSKPRPTKCKVLACIPGGEEKERTTWVMLDENGAMIDKKIWPIGHPFQTSKTSEHDKEVLDSMKRDLKDLINAHHPKVIALATCGGLIFKKIREAICEDFVSRLDFLKESQIDVQIVPDDLARIYENSERGNKEFPNENNVVKRAISVGRRLRDPLTEIAGFFNQQEILCYRFHDLQDVVPKEQLVRSLEKSFVRVVNRVGVEINRIINHPQLQSVLKFVSGLGPRKAELILNRIKQQHDEPYIVDRESASTQLLSDQKNVALNCLGFLIVRKPPNISFEDDHARQFKIIDATRVHVLSYHLAKKIVEDALETENLKLEKIHKIFKKPSLLDELDLDTYADELEKRGYGKTRITLKDIKEDLKHPFKDPRRDFKSINKDDRKVFELVTNENDLTLPKGKQVLATVVGVQDNILFCKLDNGLYGVVIRPNLDFHIDKFQDYFKVGEERYFKIREIVYKEFKVQLSPVASELPFNKKEVDQATNIKTGAPSKKRFHRQINHAAFRDFDYAQAVDFLAEKAPGELVIRPSSKGYDHLAITFKFGNNLYINYDVEEEKKGKDINSLGSTLKVNGKVFSDLDEVIYYCVENLMDYTNQLKSSSKYFDGNRDDVKNILREEKKKNPKIIPYRIVMSTSKPAKFYIYYLPGKHTVLEKSFTVTPDGYYYSSRQFKDTVKLINAFKHSCQTYEAKQTNQPSAGGWE